jgi:hypothetical protein
MTENSAVAAQNGKVTCPCAVQFRFMRLIVVLYQVLSVLPAQTYDRFWPLVRAEPVIGASWKPGDELVIADRRMDACVPNL